MTDHTTAIQDHATASPRLAVAVAPHDRTWMRLVDGGDEELCRLRIDRFAMSDGRGGWLRMDGIGDVFTAEVARGRGLAARLMAAAVERMRAGDGDLSVLYGIDGFYHRWGYVDCGDEHWVELVVVPQWGRDVEGGTLPQGWTTRSFEADDLPAMAAIYDEVAARTRGATARPLDGRTWERLLAAPAGDCRVVCDPAGAVAGWAWRGETLPDRPREDGRSPRVMVIAELQARDGEAAVVVMDAARSWAIEASGPDDPYTAVLTGAPPGHVVHEAARGQHARLTVERRPQGGMMALQLGGQAPVHDCYQYLPDRF